MPSVDDMIAEIMKPKHSLMQLKEYKKYENKKFIILKNQNNVVVIDNRSTPPEMFSSLTCAFESIINTKKVKKEKNKHKSI
jgi:hypothetical protein